MVLRDERHLYGMRMLGPSQRERVGRIRGPVSPLRLLLLVFPRTLLFLLATPDAT
jgi:hypothetical protein